MSGKFFVIRLPDNLYEVLKEEAKAVGIKPRHFATGWLVALLVGMRQKKKKETE